MKLLRRNRASDDSAAGPVPDDDASPGETAPPEETRRRRPLRASSGDGDHPATADAPATDGDGDRAGDATADATGDDAGSRSSPGRASSGLIKTLMQPQVAASRDEAEQDAARELRQFMAPAMDQLVLNVPGSTSAEDAAATLARQSSTELEKPVSVRPETIIDLRNPPEMGAYPAEEKLSNRVLRLANRHWAKGKPRPSEEIKAEKSAIAQEEFARKPVGTQRCLVHHGDLRCRGVFAFNADERSGALLRCPTCGAGHVWEESEARWAVIDVPEVEAPERDALASPS